MDLETALLLGGSFVMAVAVGIQHFYDRFHPNGLYKRSLAMATTNANAIRGAVEGLRSDLTSETVSEGTDALAELPRILQDLPIKIGESVGGAISKAQDEAMKQFERIPPEVTGAMGGFQKASNTKQAELKDAIGQGLLGPYGALLQQFMPPLYDYLVENPDMVVQALEMPVVQKLIQKAAALAGRVQSGSLTMESNEWNPGLGR